VERKSFGEVGSDAIPMPDTVIACVNALGNDQPEQLIFTDRHGYLIGDTEFPGAHFDDDEPPSETTLNIPDDDGADADADLPGVDDAAIPGVDNDVELPGVDGDAGPDVELPGVDGDAEPAPDTVEIMDLDTTTDPPIFEAESVEQEDAPVEPVVQLEAEPVAQPAETHGAARRSTRIRTPPTAYEPSMSGSKYSYAVTQLASLCAGGFLYQSEPDAVAAVMTQLSFKRGLKEWGDKAYTLPPSLK
jgi:hypothetical protein